MMIQFLSKALALLLAIPLLLSSLGADTGSNSRVFPASLTAPEQALFEKASEQLLGIKYEPLSLILKTEDPAVTEGIGTVYIYLARATVVYPGAEPYMAQLTIRERPDGSAEIMDILNLSEKRTEDAAQDETAVPYWIAGSSVLQSIVSYVEAVCDEKSADYVPPENRIAVFDMDGTLYGELFPTYFDVCLLLHRLLHDPDYQPAQENRDYAALLEKAMLAHEPEPSGKRSSGQMAAEAFKGMTVAQYRAYVRAFMSEPAVGFMGMTYGEGFYLPMVAMVRYLSEHGFAIYISSGSERNLCRELTMDTLGQWIPQDHIIGSVFSLTATGQKDTEGRKYTYQPEDQVVLEGNMLIKNQKMNKVSSILNEIGQPPILVFGNSSGDLAMGEYAVQSGGKAYMLLCDDTERDYGSLDVAAAFAQECAKFGFETISMRDDFAAIYQDGAVKTPQDGVLDPAA